MLIVMAGIGLVASQLPRWLVATAAVMVLLAVWVGMAILLSHP